MFGNIAAFPGRIRHHKPHVYLEKNLKSIDQFHKHGDSVGFDQKPSQISSSMISPKVEDVSYW